MTQKTRSISSEIEIDAPIEAVWKALTDAEELTRWFPLQAGVKSNGIMWMSWNEAYYFESRADVVEPYKRIRAVAVTPEGVDPPRVEVATDTFLETRGGKTVVRIVHSGFSPDTAWDDLYDATRRGWQFELRGLRHYLENHAGTPRETIWVRRQLDTPVGDIWAKLMQKDGFADGGAFEGLREYDSYSMTTALGDHYSGLVYVNDPPYQLSFTARELNNAYLRLKVETLPLGAPGGPTKTDANFFLSLYGVADEQVESLRERWTRHLASVLR